ncbi:MAG TPA: 4Fe-4S binding protein, partial [Thermoplasmata archaeon]|nr:4Fe-4S binding protein [Thermoplasmata archaeon]
MREEHGNIAPVMVSKGEPIGLVVTDVPYQLITILSNIYGWIPSGKIAVLCRKCDEKSLAEYFKRGYFDPKRIIKIGLACTKEQVAKCRCSDPVPSKVDIGESQRPVDKDDLSERLLAMSPPERLRFWTHQFRKCNKCFACTTMCPVCFCDECVLEERTFVPENGIPPGMAFHLIRGYHLADKCIECGECERACPAEIPLLTFRKMTGKDMRMLFKFSPGDSETKSPLLTTLEGEPL